MLAFDAREAFTPKEYIHIIPAYGFSMVYVYLFLKKLREMKYLIQAVFASKV